MTTLAALRVPHYVTAFDGTAWTDSVTFEDYDSAHAYAVEHFSQDDIDDGLVGIVPEFDVDEGRVR